jgi:Protein of unknown function (DUF1800)
MVPAERSTGYVVREMRQCAPFCKCEFLARRAWQRTWRMIYHTVKHGNPLESAVWTWLPPRLWCDSANAITTSAPFRERLVWFWTNHFVVSIRRAECTTVAAAFVEEAIRPHVTRRFGDMLLAVMRHPANAAVSRPCRIVRA